MQKCKQCGREHGINKGQATAQFEKGQRIKYLTNLGSRKRPIRREDFGTICKVHCSGKQGTVELYPEDGTKKISRRIQCIEAV